MNITLNEVVKYFLTYYWFTGEECSKCGATVNMLRCAHSHGFFCEGCGEYVPVVWSHNSIPHENPTYGPDKSMLVEAREIIKNLKPPIEFEEMSPGPYKSFVNPALAEPWPKED